MAREKSGSLQTLRHWLYVNLHAGAWRRAGMSPLNKIIGYESAPAALAWMQAILAGQPATNTCT